ncbi:MAG: divergent polysaccharide deacetylase family protein [Hyphomicrobiales bacterium]|nr:divergent polysaccharide deacetylase family protein [Hyphomicrobiales bacterium]
MGLEQLRQHLRLFLSAIHSAGASKMERLRGHFGSMRRRHVMIPIVAVGLVCGALFALISGWSNTGGSASATAQLSVPEQVHRPEGPGRKPDGFTIPAYEPSSYAGIPVAPSGTPLVEAPVPLLTEFKNGLQLPRISPSGRPPWKVYGQPFDPSDVRPKIVIVVTEFGLSPVASQAMIDILPSAVTFVSSPYADNSEYWVREARADGHEVFVLLPVQSADPGFADPGPRAVRTSLPLEETTARLEAALGTCLGCSGVMISASDQLLRKDETISYVLNTVQRRGLMLFVATPPKPGPMIRFADDIQLTRAWANTVLDEDLAAGQMDEQLVELLEIARRQGVAIGLARPVPATVRRLSIWWRSIESQNFVLAPLTAAANLQDPGL